jgi:hypothetical protein
MYVDDLDIDTTSSNALSRVNDYWYATENGVYCYYSMSTSTSSGNYAGYLDKNEEVLVERANSTWAECKVRINNKDTLVYVERKYLSEVYGSSSSSSGGTMYRVNETWYANQNNTPIYKTTSTSNRMGYLYAGEEVEVIRANSTWAEVEAYNSDTRKYVTGYIEVRYLDEEYYGYNTSSSGWTKVERIYYTNASRVKSYSKMDTSDPFYEKGTLYMNTPVYVEARTGAWAAVTKIDDENVNVYIEFKYLSTKRS